MKSEETIENFLDAWSERDARLRDRFLDSSWSDEGVLVQGHDEKKGRPALIHVMESLRSDFPDIRFRLQSVRADRQGKIVFCWVGEQPGGQEVVHGESTGTLGPDGRLSWLQVTSASVFQPRSILSRSSVAEERVA